MSFVYASLLRFGRNCTEGVSFPSELCSTFVLRSINVCFSLICAVLFQQILLHLKSESSDKVTFLKAFALTCYPLHWFFTFLYYTDVGSTTAVFAMYLASLKRSYWMSAMVSDLPFIVKFLWLCILRKYWQLSEDLVLWMCWNFLIICAVWICCNPVQANKCYLGDFRYLYRSNWFYIQAAS